MLGGEVVLFADVGLEVVEGEGGVEISLAQAFPSALVEGCLAETAFVEFPVKELMGWLGSTIAEECGEIGRAHV